jgi:glutamyl-tRNA synthetase
MVRQAHHKLFKVRTRFAPSPTGTPESVHLGFVIRALWNYAYAKKNHGQFILRIEDTDRKRSNNATENAILNVLKKFNIEWDEGPDIGGKYGPYRQSERLDKYQQAAHILVEKGYAYYDFNAQVREKEEIKEAYKSKDKLALLKVRPDARDADSKESLNRVKNGEKFVVRIKIPENRVFEYDDWILKKKVKFFGKEVPDMILLKSDGFPTYHLAVVVDDVSMKISHVFRGQEWISSTPIHLYIYEGLDKKVPQLGHFSVILDPRTGKKFSKRDMTAMFGVDNWLKKGYLPQAILNYLMLLGWAPKDNREFFTIKEFIQFFDQDGIQKANPTFDEKKLDWFNQHYLQEEYSGHPEKFLKYAKELSEFSNNVNFDNIVLQSASFMPSRMNNIYDFDGMMRFFFNVPQVDTKIFGKDYKKHLKSVFNVIDKVENWNLNNLNEKLMEEIKSKDYKTGDFFMDLRIAITGKKFTPPINDSIIILGKEETLKRIKSLL